MIVPAANLRLVMTTAGSREEAEEIARALVDEHLAACVNLLPAVHSIYRWKGVVEDADEILLMIKTTAENLERVRSGLSRMHSYEVPEFVVLHPESASKPYFDWLLHEATPH